MIFGSLHFSANCCDFISLHGYVTFRYTFTTFIYSSVDGHLDCLHILADVNRAAMNVDMRVPLWYVHLSLLGVDPREI